MDEEAFYYGKATMGNRDYNFVWLVKRKALKRK
jgi:hypothetical protein